MSVLFNPLAKKGFDDTTIPEYDADPSSPAAEEAWVTRAATGGGEAIGLLLSLTTAGSTSYVFRYRTKEGTTVEAALT